MKYYFTFGQNHVHPETGELLKDYWVEVENKSMGEATELMFAAFKDKWSMQYNENDFDKSFFPKGCYEKLGGNQDVVFSMKALTTDEAVKMIMDKLQG